MAKISVKLLDTMGDDVSVVNAARVSFDKTSHWEWPGPHLSEKDEKLVQYLATHGHWSPFSHCFASFRVSAPIFVARQLQKHTVGLAWNEVSRRYVDSEPEFYVPEKWRKKADNVKQGSSDEEVKCIWQSNGWRKDWDGDVTECPIEKHVREGDQEEGTPQNAYKYTMVPLLHLYQDMLDAGVCPEQARMVLPQSMMTEWIWSGSLYAFARVCNLRLDPHTQKETRDVAVLIADYMEFNFPASWKALTNR